MKHKTLIAAWLVASLFAGTAAGQNQPQQDRLQMLAKRSYLSSLNSEHACIRNSTIFRVMQYRAAYPQDDLRPFVKALREMSVKDASPQNRLYAFVACTFLENEKLWQAAGKPPKQEDGKEAYFARLQGILQSNEAVAKE